MAAEAGSTEGVRVLLDRWADLDAKDSRTGYPAPAWAGKFACCETIELLLKRDAYVDLGGRLPEYLLKVAGGKQEGASMLKRALQGPGEFSLGKSLGEVERDTMRGMLVWAAVTTEIEIMKFLRRRGVEKVGSLSLKEHEADPEPPKLKRFPGVTCQQYLLSPHRKSVHLHLNLKETATTASTALKLVCLRDAASSI